MNIYEHQLNNIKHLSIKVLKEALKEATNKNYISKLRGIKRCNRCKYVFPENDAINHCKCN